MPALASCRLLVDPPASGPWNMAVDETLLDSGAESGTATFRFYQWSEPTLSLGYFQRYADRQSHRPSSEVRAVRRLSGGGAILHDREWTYSLVLPSGHPLASEAQALYQAVHEVLLRQLKQAASLANENWRLQLCEPEVANTEDAQPFLCFARRAPGDIVLQRYNRSDSRRGDKVVGSAQRRRRGTVLQHGSILLHTSENAPELKGFCDATGAKLSQEVSLPKLTVELAETLQVTFEPASLTPDEHAAAQQLVESKYATAAWTERR